MRLILVSIILASAFWQTVNAQKNGTRFSSATSIGVATGERGSALMMETVNGVKFSKWFAGVGVGLDYYQYKSLPLFINGRRYFDKNGKAFVYGSAGYNLPLKNKPGPELGFYSDYYFSGGLLAEGGVAYSISLSKKSSVVISLGYSHKELEMKSSVKICGIVPPCWEESYRYEFKYNRVVMKLGFEF